MNRSQKHDPLPSMLYNLCSNVQTETNIITYLSLESQKAQVLFPITKFYFQLPSYISKILLDTKFKDFLLALLRNRFGHEYSKVVMWEVTLKLLYFMQCGPILMIILGIVAMHCMLLLVQCSQALCNRWDCKLYYSILEFTIAF